MAGCGHLLVHRGVDGLPQLRCRRGGERQLAPIGDLVFRYALVTGNAHAIVVGYVTFRTVLAALAGRRHAWNKLNRRNSVNSPPPNSQLPGQLVYVDSPTS